MSKCTPPPIGFGDRLQKAIFKSGYTNARLEKICGVNHTCISRYVTGDMSPSIGALAKLCKALHVSADYLLFGNEG